MDLFDVEILKALRKDSIEFYDILSYVDFSHNTLREHLNKLVDQGLVERVKRPQNGARRALSFDSLRRVCRHEKGGYCKEIRGQCKAINCPPIRK